MQKRRFRQYRASAALIVVLLLGGAGQTLADSSSSPHYKVDQTQFNSGAQQTCSDNFCSKTIIGDIGTNDSSSANYNVSFNTELGGEPQLEVIALGGIQNLGTLDVDHTATSTNIIKVRNYLSSGYIIQIVGKSPGQGTHDLSPIATPSTSHPGAEQFGINMVANTAPKVGDDPKQITIGQNSIGTASDDYVTPNLFKYSDGDIVAHSESSSGETDYTLSMIVNVSNTTPVGHYAASFSAVVVPIY